MLLILRFRGVKKEGVDARNVKFQAFPLNAGMVSGFQIRNAQTSGLQIQKSRGR
jgi:hypothetical protein